MDTVGVGDVGEFEEVFHGAVYSSVGDESEEVNLLVVVFGILIGFLDCGVLQYSVVATCNIDFDKVLVDYSSGSDVEVSYFGVTHLSVGKSDVFAGSLQLGVGICFQQVVPIGCWGLINGVVCLFVSYSPAIADYKKGFFAHDYCLLLMNILNFVIVFPAFSWEVTEE
jgi:hypothetical protein